MGRHQLNGTAHVLFGSYWLETLGKAVHVSVMCRILPLRVTSGIDVDRDASWWMGQSIGVHHASVCLTCMVGEDGWYFADLYSSMATQADTNQNQASGDRPHPKVLIGNCCVLSCI